jgi:predicted CoA-binding protein
MHDPNGETAKKVLVKIKKPTLVIGASEKSDRYSYRAVKMLLAHGHPVWAIGRRKGKIGDTIIETEPIFPENLDTLTLYLSPENQKSYYDFILSLRPKRIIFNPGTENPELSEIAESIGIQCIEGCTLVMLQTEQF